MSTGWFKSAAAALVLLVATCSASDAFALRQPAFTTTAEVDCQNAVFAGGRSLLAARLKSWALCLAKERRGGASCDGVEAVASEAELRTRLDNQCASLGSGFDNALGLGATVAEAGDQIAAGASSAASTIMQTLLAANGRAKASGVRRRCLGSIAKAALLAIRGELRANGRCLRTNDEQQVRDGTALPACDDGKRRSRRQASQSRAVALIEKRCSQAEVLAASEDAVADASSAVRFASHAGRGQLCSWYPQARNWPICFDQVERIELTRVSEIGSLGWPGIFHGIASNEALPFQMELRNCTTADEERSCDLFQATEGQRFTLLHSVFGGAPSCALYRALANRTGTIRFNSNFEPLALNLDEPYEVEVFLGSDFASPCPSCTGAKVGDEGVCIGGERDGLECVSMRSQDGFPLASLDCPPPEILRVDTLKVVAGSSDFSSNGQHYPATEACTASDAENCHCPNQAAPNNCATGVCPAEDGFCLNDGGQPVLCLPSPYSLAGGNPIGDEITIAQATCVDAASAPLKVLVGVPGPMATSQRVKVRPL